jgi:L-alanine-DL-glutamate epimerase-like enolase superfamily enzyme
MLSIVDYEIYKIQLPLGRVIGDNNCHYDEMELLCINLKTNHGHMGWGYAESVWKGTFTRSAWYIKQLPSEHELDLIFQKTWWPILKNQDPNNLELIRKNFHSGLTQIDAAIRLAIWDLMAKDKNVPVYKLLNPSSVKTEALSYGSILDYPLNDEETVALTKNFLNRGFSIIKIKIGAPDVARDIARINLIKSVVGNNIKLTADANEAWTWQIALDRIEMYQKNGIELEYIEDPLPNDDIKGFKELTSRSPIPIIGHDYINNFEQLHELVNEGGIHGIRTGKDIDYSLQCIALATEHNLPVYLGNSIFEINAHLALAFDQVNRTEFSLLNTNDIIEQPIVFKNGNLQAPIEIGHGLYPIMNKLILLSEPDKLRTAL